MQRRAFLNILGLAATSSLLPVSHLACGPKERRGELKAGDIHKYLRSLIEVQEPSVDRIIVGDPETRVTKIGTAWMPYWKTLRKAKDKGINTLVVHEPTFYSHWDYDAKDTDFLKAPSVAKETYLKLREEKKTWILENGIVIIRCHDVLDKIPSFGIPFAFGKLLGFKDEDLLRSRTYYNVYQTEAKPAIDIASEIAAKLKPLGQPGVAFYGRADFQVRSIGLGTGCISNPMQFMDMNPDLYVAIDDVVKTWVETTYAEDTGRPLVIINHGTSEEHGMQMLNAQLKKAFPDYDVIHLAQGCGYRWVEA